MGEIAVDIELENSVDRIRFLDRQLAESAIRCHTMKAVVDTGAIALMLPQEVVEKLGLRTKRKVIVTYADERKDERAVAGPVTIQIGDRFMDTECIFGPLLSEALIGQVVMEMLDLIPDCAKQTLTPRPESPIYPLLNLK